jgi:nucleoside-triphosphatase THEP1
MGSLWASFEIIVGSFLHNLHLPFSGTSLTFASVFLVIAFIQFWKDKGLVWRAGLICALMKSLSPSAVIIGPMVGIMTEALIIELILRIAGRNLISYMIAGGLAVTSALFHKVISLLILYGLDLVKIFEGIYQYALKQLRITELAPVNLIIILLALYLTAGFFAAILGYFAGRTFKQKSIQAESPEKIALETGNRLFDSSERRGYSVFLLFGHLVILVLCLWLINSGNYYIFLPVSLLYIVGCFTWYKKSLRYLKKVSFWIQFSIITFLAAFLLEGYSSGNYFSAGGMVIGLKMNLRAFVIMVGFTAISTELKNPLIRSILYSQGFSSVYQSLNLAFSALPGIIASLPKPKDFIRNRTSVISYLFSQSEMLLEQFGEEHAKRPPVIIITGNVGQGKTTFTQSITEKLAQQGIRISGFFSVGIHEDGRRIGFDLIDIQTGQRLMISRNSFREGWKKQGHYYFNPEVFLAESELLKHQIEEGSGLFVIDEVGPLELNDSGWSPLIQQLCTSNPSPMIWIIRQTLVKRAARKWHIGNIFIFTLEEDNEEELMHLLQQLTSAASHKLQAASHKLQAASHKP